MLTLLTREGGKLSALARSARKSRRRFGGALQSFSVSEVELGKRGRAEIWTLRSATPDESFPSIAMDVGALAHASYATELCRELTAVEVPEVHVFDLLVELYRCVADHGPKPLVLRGFELALLRAGGLEPRFDLCALCGETVGSTSRALLFDPSAGGVVCASCAPRVRSVGVCSIEAGVAKVLTACAEAKSLVDCIAIEGDPVAVAGARDLMLQVVGQHVPGRLKSLDFIAKMRAAGG